MRLTIAALGLLAALVPAAAQSPVTLYACEINAQGLQVCSQGASPTHVISAASTNATSIKTRPGTLYTVTGINTNAAAAYLKLYDVAAAPTCNTDTVVATYPLIQNIPVVVNSAIGKTFANGIGLCITAGIADNDNTNATTGIAVSLDYR